MLKDCNLGNDTIQPNIVRPRGDFSDFLIGIGKADSKNRLACEQISDGAVIIAGAIAKPVALAVEGEKGDQQNIRLDFGGCRSRFENAHGVDEQSVTLFVEAEDQGLSFAGDNRQGDGVALGAEPIDELGGINLLMNRAIAGNNPTFLKSNVVQEIFCQLVESAVCVIGADASFFPHGRAQAVFLFLQGCAGIMVHKSKNKAEGSTSTGGVNSSAACISRWAPYILTTVRTGTAP